ncbi:hypothetical protein A176_004149 [Myxococcus hansupus]|uniref:Beta-ketoacyl synthase N-terminal domain-containing protein n=1 Tax=Pseudomyxococcus hansupus TaxID=1297742 RepID=A0A0H4XG78_9BACT|nr:hypothetical protein A176_004149 [Myxococcus hansupus]
MRHGRLQRVLIVAADSLLAPGVLEQLGAQRRLKFEGQPVGLTPGEAGVCLLLELESSARKRNAPPQARLAGVATAQEENHRESGSTTTGTGLAKCIHQVLDLLPEPASFGGDIYADLNGEEWRAREWGYASVRIEQRMKAPEVHVPCAHVGDTGAASGALGICMALHALARGHARAGHALVLSSSERGQVGSVCLGAP